jgi:outer membrane protein OmpA-like peptidoglycan-associated protein
MKNIFNKKIIIILCAALFMSGCTTLNPYTGENQVSNTTIGAGVGAIGGTLVGAMIGGRDGALIGAGIGGLTGGMIGHSMDDENAELRQRLMGTGVQVREEGNSIQLIMASDVTFATDSANIRSDFYPTLDSVALVIKKYHRTSIIVSGYTDSTGSAEHNQILSEQRAKSVSAYLASQGVRRNRLFARGFGARHPIASNQSVSGRAMNRRVVINLRPL